MELSPFIGNDGKMPGKAYAARRHIIHSRSNCASRFCSTRTSKSFSVCCRALQFHRVRRTDGDSLHTVESPNENLWRMRSHFDYPESNSMTVRCACCWRGISSIGRPLLLAATCIASMGETSLHRLEVAVLSFDLVQWFL